MNKKLMGWLAPLAAIATILSAALAFWIWWPVDYRVATMRRLDGSPDRSTCLLFEDGTRSDTADNFACVKFPARHADTTADLIDAVSGRKIKRVKLIAVGGSQTLEIITDDE